MLYCLFNDVLLKLAVWLVFFFTTSVKIKILTERERKDGALCNEQRAFFQFSETSARN